MTLRVHEPVTHRLKGVRRRVKKLRKYVSGKTSIWIWGTYTKEINDSGLDNFTIIVHASISICDDTGHSPRIDRRRIGQIGVYGLERSPIPNIQLGQASHVCDIKLQVGLYFVWK